MVMGTQAGPIEHDDRWILSLRGLRVTGIGVDFQLTLTLDTAWSVTLETPFQLIHGSASAKPGSLLTPGSQDVAAALPLFGATVLSAVAFKSGSLRMVFDNGTHLKCSTDPEFEAWQVAGPQGWRFVSLPGGGLTVRSGSGPSEKPSNPTVSEATPLTA